MYPRQIYLEVYKIEDNKESTTASAHLSENATASITDNVESPNDTFSLHTFTIVYDDSDNFTDLKLTLKMRYNQTRISDYWEWFELMIEGSVKGEGAIKNGQMNVAPRSGFLVNSTADINCQRDFAVCAPRGLSWTCDDQIFESLKSKDNTSQMRITFPGLELQPFFGNVTAKPLR